MFGGCKPIGGGGQGPQAPMVATALKTLKLKRREY